MKTWISAGERISRRRSPDVVSQIPSAAYAFDFSTYNSPTADFLDAILVDPPADADWLVAFPDRIAAYVGDALTADSKFMHVLDSARANVARGAMTWGTVDAYHASLLGAKAILAHFGVISYDGGERSLLIDFFPELGPPDYQKKFKKDVAGADDMVRVMRPSSVRLLEQGDIWKLVERIVNLRAFATSEEERLLILIRESIKSRPWRMRNDILYNTISWRWRFDIALCPLGSADLDSLMRVDDAEIAEFVDFLDAIYSLVGLYHDQLIEAASLPPISVPAGLGTCNVPNVLN